MSFDRLLELHNNNHFWLTGKNKLIKRLVLKKKPQNVADIGCGTGSLSADLLKSGLEVTGIDIDKRAVKYCKDNVKGVKFLVASADKLPFNDDFFDIVIASDIIEHLDEEQTTLTELRRITKNGGNLLITVPAFSFLFSKADQRAGHKRRYSKKSIIKLLEEAGFKITYLNYYIFLLFPLIILSRVLNLEENRKSKVINKFVSSIISFEVTLSSRIPMPVGSTLVAMGRKLNV